MLGGEPRAGASRCCSWAGILLSLTGIRVLQSWAQVCDTLGRGRVPEEHRWGSARCSIGPCALSLVWGWLSPVPWAAAWLLPAQGAPATLPCCWVNLRSQEHPVFGWGCPTTWEWLLVNGANQDKVHRVAVWCCLAKPKL